MGFPSNAHIRQFVQGKTIDRMTTQSGGAVIILEFTNGESLKLVTVARLPERPRIETIATPFRSDGSVMQSTQIMEAAEATEEKPDDPD